MLDAVKADSSVRDTLKILAKSVMARAILPRGVSHCQRQIVDRHAAEIFATAFFAPARASRWPAHD